MAKFRVILKSGQSFVMECESVTAKYSTVTGGLCNLAYNQCRTNIPIYLNVAEVVAVIQENTEDVSE